VRLVRESYRDELFLRFDHNDTTASVPLSLIESYTERAASGGAVP